MINNNDVDAWAGSIMFSTDSVETYTPGFCIDCAGGADATLLVADGNSDGKKLASTMCLNGKTCRVANGSEVPNHGGIKIKGRLVDCQAMATMAQVVAVTTPFVAANEMVDADNSVIMHTVGGIIKRPTQAERSTVMKTVHDSKGP